MKNTRRILIIALALFMLAATSTASFAATTFTDVATNYWGRAHIMRAAEKGIVSGSLYNGKPVFKPEDPVSKVEALIMVYKTLKVTNKLQSKENFTNKYKTVMASYNIPEWAYEYVAYAAEHNIISGSELAGLMSGTKQTSASRQQVAVYLGKAIDSSTKVSSVSPLTFIDREIIDATALPYVQLLVNKKIISGDDNNRFNPKNTIKRVEMATICSKAYDVLNAADIIVEVPVTRPTPVEEEEEIRTTKKLGTIRYIAIDTRTLLVEYEEGEDGLYEIASSTKILIDNVQKTINNLKKGQKVSLEFDKNNRLIKVEVNPKESKIEGYIDSVLMGDLYHRVVVGGNFYKVFDDTDIEIKGRAASIDDLSENDSVTIHYDGDKALLITVDNRNQNLTGVLESSVDFTKHPYSIKIRTVGNETRELKIDDDTTVRRNNKRAYLEDLYIGDIATITVEDNIITRIEAASGVVRSKEDEGTLAGIAISNTIEMTILNDDNQEITHKVHDSVSVYINGEKSSFYDLKPKDNYYTVKLKLENDFVTRIDAERVRQANSISGVITRVHNGTSRIIVRTYNTSDRRPEELTVFVNKDTEIYYKGKIQYGIRYLAEEDEIFINGEYEDGLFVATNIFVYDN